METEFSYMRENSNNLNYFNYSVLHSENPIISRQQAPSPPVEIDPLDLRFSILRQLVPHGSELQERDDILKVVFEYVKDLESEIQNFNDGLGIASEEGMGALQKKGLCIVQVSKLTKAF